MYIGFSKTDITPEPGLPMAGYVNRKGKSIGAHDSLNARILYMSSNDDDLVLISLDLIRVDDNLREKLEAVIMKNYGIKNVIITATHTHSGPEVSLDLWSTRELNESDKKLIVNYLDELTWKINNAIANAVEKSSKVKDIKVISSNIKNVATNRIDNKGPIDEEAIILIIENEYEKTLLLNYACHPTVLGSDNLLYSGDLAGLTIKYIEESLGVNAMYLNGAAGNISTRFSRSKQDFQEALNLSKSLANQVITGVLSSNATKLKPIINIGSLNVRLTLKEPASNEILDELEKQFIDKLVKAKSEGAPPPILRALESDVYAIKIAKRRNSILRNTRSLNIELKVLTIDKELVMITFPGELFIEYQLELKQLIKPRKLMLLGYANGYIGYVPHPNYIGRMCYEEIVSLLDKIEYYKIKDILSQLVLGNYPSR